MVVIVVNFIFILQWTKKEVSKMIDKNDSKYDWDSLFALGIFFAGVGMLLYGVGVFLSLFI